MDVVAADVIMPILRANLSREARLATDDHGVYRRAIKDFAAHGVVRHSRGQYGYGDIHTNTIEGYFSIFKRGMRGIYQWCGKNHLHRYLAEYDFRYSNREANGINDKDRADLLLAGVVARPHLSKVLWESVMPKKAKRRPRRNRAQVRKRDRKANCRGELSPTEAEARLTDWSERQPSKALETV